MTYQTTFGSRQIVRPLARHERIPSLSTASLLMLIPVNPVEPKPLTSQEIKIRQARERFAPHIEKINAMRKQGLSLRKIEAEIGIGHDSLSRYIAKHPELFK